MSAPGYNRPAAPRQHPPIDRILVLLASAEDTAWAVDLLAQGGARAHPCADMDALCRELAGPTGAVLVAEELLGTPALQHFAETLAQQPAWSDLPVLILTKLGAEDAGWQRVSILERIGNATLIERPVRVVYFASILQAALRARRRQYELGALLAERETNERSARKAARAEQALRAQATAAREDMERVLQSIRDGFMLVDRAWRFTYVNDQAARLAGWRAEEMTGKSLWELFPETLGTRFYTELQRAMGRREPVSFDYHYERLQRCFEYRAYPQPQGLVLLQTDITDRRQAEAHRAQLAAVVHASTNAIIGQTPEGIITSWNQAAEDVYGYPAAEAVGRSIYMIVPPDRQEELKELLMRVRRGESARLETVRVRRDGTSVPISLGLAPIVDASGAVVGISSVSSDLRERLRAEQAVRDSEERYRRLVELSPSPVLVNFGGQIAYVNPAMLAFLGISNPETVLGQSPIEYVHPDSRAVVAERVARLTATGQPVPSIEEKWLRADGTVRIAEVTATPLPWQGQTAIQVILHDTTERKRFEDAMRESEERYRRLIELSPAAVFVHLDNRIVYANPASLALFGLTSASELLGRSKFEFVHPDLTTVIQQRVRRMYETGEPSSPMEQRWIRSDGTPFDVEVFASPLPWGGMTAIQVIARDITERKRFEEALRQNEARFRAALQSAPIVAFEQDRELRYTWIHNAAPGFDPNTIVGRRDPELLERPDEAAALEVFKRRVLESGKADRSCFTVHVAGKRHQYELIAEPLRDAHGIVVGIACAAMDISEHTELQDRLRRQAEQLARMDARKNEFIAMLAHELRNPLAPIHNAVHVLKIQPDPPKAGEVHWAIDVVGRQVRQLSRLVDDLLDVARITHGQIPLEKEVLDLREVLSQAVEGIGPGVAERRQHLVYGPPPEPLYVEGDRARLVQLVSNLLNNASRYTHKGGHLGLEARREEATVIFIVWDHGSGIPPETLPHIFDPFYRGARNDSGQESGLGLGLALVQRLVQLHGGDILAESAGAGRGASFTVRLPAVTSPQDEQPPSRPTKKPGAMRILVVDDNTDAAQSFAMLLELLGHVTEAAHSGMGGLEAAARLRPEVVFLDLDLPDIDGYEVASRLRAMALDPGPRIVALTGFGHEEVRRRVESSGFDAHLLKPVSLETLQVLLARLERR